MTGIWVERKKKGLSAKKLASMTGVAPSSIRKWERKIPKRFNVIYLLALADVLEAMVDDLIKTHDDVLPPNEDRVPYKCKYPPENCIEIYRRRKMLSYRQLGKYLGISKQAASQICRKSEPGPKYLTRLAELEDMSPAEFERVYAVKEEEWA